MKTFERICYVVCMVSIAVSLLLILTLIWGEETDEFMWKALGTSLACLFASGIAFAITRAVLKKPAQTKTKTTD